MTLHTHEGWAERIAFYGAGLEGSWTAGGSAVTGLGTWLISPGGESIAAVQNEHIVALLTALNTDEARRAYAREAP